MRVGDVMDAAEANGILDSGEDIICVRGVSQLNIIRHFLGCRYYSMIRCVLEDG